MATYSSDVTAGQDIFAGDINKVRQDLFLGAKISQTVSPAATVTFDFSSVANGNIKTITLDQDINVRFSGITKYPTLFAIRFVQNSSGGHAITILETCKFIDGVATDLISEVANEVTTLGFICWGSGDFECYPIGYALSTP